MPVVPRVEQQIGGTLIPNIYQTARADALSQGGGFARGLQAVGGGVADLALGLKAMDDRQKLESDQAELLAATNEADKLARDLLFDPNSGYLAQAGRTASQNRDAVLKAYNDGIGQIKGKLSGQDLQQQFDLTYSGKQTAFSVDVYQHSLKETQAWRAGEEESRITNATDYAAATWADPQRLAVNIQGVRSAATNFAAQQGYGEEETQAYVRGKVSTAHFAATQQMLAANDIFTAADYVQKHRDEFSAKHLLAIDAAVREAAQVVGGQVLGDEAIRIGKAKTDPVGALLVQREVSDTLWSAQVSIESANDPSAVSDKGAAGLAQVMPDTARWVAQQLGENDVAAMTDAEITEWLKTPENSMRYGRFYMNAMLDRFDGDTVLALSAYNAGPENVEKWVEKYGDPRMGELTSLDFAERIPFAETRDYVSKVLTKANRAGQVTGGGDWYAAALEEAAKIEDPTIRDMAVRRIESAKDAEESVAKRSSEQLQQGAEAFIEAGGNPDDLPPQTRQALGATKMNQYREAYDKKNDRKTDFALYDELSRMDAETLATYDLFAVQHRLEPKHYNEMKQRQADAQKIVGGQAVEYSPFTLTQRRSALFQRLGIDGTKGADQRGRLSAWIDRALRDAAKVKGAPLTADEEDRIMQRSLSVVSDGGWFSGDVTLGEVDELSDLPSEVQQGLRDAFPDMTDQDRLDTYMRMRLSGAIQ